MAMPAATPALMLRVDPNCAIDTVSSAAARACAALLRDHLRDHMASRTYEAAFAEMASADAVAHGAGSGLIAGVRP